MTTRLETDVRAILDQGGNPAAYRQGLASRHGVTVDVVDATIAAIGGTPREVDAETVAQERLDHDRHMTKQDPAAARAYNHDEE